MTTPVRNWLRAQGREYRHGEERPLASYATLMSVYAGATSVAALIARVRRRPVPVDLSPWQLAQLSIATFSISRLVTKDPVTSPFRAPFTEYDGLSAPGELSEEVRGHGVRHSVGELLTCPMCLAQWVATALYFGLIFVPTPTRAVLATFTAVAGSDVLQHAYVLLQQAGEK
jgi:hypothetical protein